MSATVSFLILSFLICSAYFLFGKRQRITRCPYCLRYEDQDGTKINALDLSDRERVFPQEETCQECVLRFDKLRGDL